MELKSGRSSISGMNAKPSAKPCSNRSRSDLCHRRTSVGLEDHAPTLLEEIGTLLVHGIPMRPAAPTGFGLIGPRKVFLLPGNPVSCLSAYDCFVGLALRRLGGLLKTGPTAKQNFRSVKNRFSNWQDRIRPASDSRRKSRTDCLGRCVDSFFHYPR